MFSMLVAADTRRDCDRKVRLIIATVPSPLRISISSPPLHGGETSLTLVEATKFKEITNVHSIRCHHRRNIRYSNRIDIGDLHYLPTVLGNCEILNLVVSLG